MKHGIARERIDESEIFCLILGEHHLKFHSCEFPEWEILRFRVMTLSLIGELHHIDEISKKSKNRPTKWCMGSRESRKLLEACWG